MIEYSPEQIAAFIEQRVQSITKIERLWTQLCNLRNEPVRFRALDAEINEYFSVSAGRNALAFESIAALTAKLENEIQNFNGESLKRNENIVALYADGGVIKKNPSPFGGTWAWCGVNAEGERVIEKYGAVPATETRTISNNHTEQIAITLALEAMPEKWSGIVYSDSQIALGRVFKGWRENNLPKNIAVRSKQAVARLGRIETVLLQGHPTKEDLKNGIGKKRGFPVSEHNVWCDKHCNKAAEEFWAKAQITQTI